jgi:osmotically-inducible protein OsmY
MADRYDWERDRGHERDRERDERRWDWDRGREREGEPRGEWSRNRTDYGPEGESGRQGDYGRHGEYGRQGEFGRQGDYGRQGEFGRRGDYGRQGDWSRHNDREREGDWGRQGEWRRQGEWGRQGHQQGDWGRQGAWGSFGNRSDYDRPSSGSYAGGMGSFGGGMGTYGERGQHAGRGPKGWQRSDDRIREDINERLTDDPEIDAGEIEVVVKGGEVTLTGSVDDRHAKRRAEDIVERVSGVKEIHNQLRLQQGLLNNQQGQPTSQHSQQQKTGVSSGTSTKR